MSLPAEVWVAVAFIAVLAVIQCLATLARVLQYEIARQELIAEVRTLRSQNTGRRSDVGGSSRATAPDGASLKPGPRASAESASDRLAGTESQPALKQAKAA